MVICFMKISLAVIGYQIFYVVAQITMRAIFNRGILVFTYLCVMFLTYAKTYNGLFIFQTIVQTLVFLFLFKFFGKEQMDNSESP
jgi:hypothetical protein